MVPSSSSFSDIGSKLLFLMLFVSLLIFVLKVSMVDSILLPVVLGFISILLSFCMIVVLADVVLVYATGLLESVCSIW